MFLVGSKGAFRAHQGNVLLELRAHQKNVLLELRSQQTAHIELKVVILAIYTRKTANNVKLLYLFYPSFKRHFFHVIVPLNKYMGIQISFSWLKSKIKKKE